MAERDAPLKIPDGWIFVSYFFIPSVFLEML